jgi:hypothetical protein
MSFSVSNLSLTVTISESLRGIQDELFHGPVPQVLHHYTKASTVVQSIIRNRALWATCIADQSDQSEISHVSEKVALIADQLQVAEISEFTRDVFKRLPFFMEERKQWIFISCFCDDHDSDLHWREYGDYRLTFPSPWSGAPSLGLLDPHAECWYQRVIYDEQKQVDAMERALQAISKAISFNTSGQNEGPWAQAMIDSCARNTAQLILGIAVGFKRSLFRGEREWRIVCAPRLGSNSSAPQWIDENFAVNIKRSPRRHVPLQVHREPRLFEPLLIPPVPFMAWAWSPNCLSRDAVDEINEALKANHRSDLAHTPKSFDRTID